jgi:hypothetical protein
MSDEEDFDEFAEKVGTKKSQQEEDIFSDESHNRYISESFADHLRRKYQRLKRHLKEKKQ